MSQLKTNSITNIGNTGDANIELYADGSTSIRNLQNLAPNLAVNGAMTVAQRGVGPVSDAGYQTADRIATTYTTPQSNCSQEVSTDNPPAGFAKFFRFKNLAAVTDTAADWREIYYKVEGQYLLNCGWNQKSTTDNMTFSFYVRSSVTQVFYGRVSTTFGGLSDRNFPFEIDCTANVWTKVVVVIPGDANLRIADDNTEGFRFNIVPFWGSDYTGSTAQLNKWQASDQAARTPDFDTTWASTVNATFDVTGIQLTHTDAPIEFQHEDYGTTLLKCQRYYQRIGFKENAGLAVGFETGTSLYGTLTFVNEMRASPDIIATAAAGYTITTTAVAQTCTDFSVDGGSPTTARTRFIHPNNADFLNKGAAVAYCNSDDAGISLSAEL